MSFYNKWTCSNLVENILYDKRWKVHLNCCPFSLSVSWLFPLVDVPKLLDVLAPVVLLPSVYPNCNLTHTYLRNQWTHAPNMYPCYSRSLPLQLIPQQWDILLRWSDGNVRSPGQEQRQAANSSQQQFILATQRVDLCRAAIDQRGWICIRFT